MESRKVEVSFGNWLEAIPSDLAMETTEFRMRLLDFANHIDEHLLTTQPIEKDEAVDQARKEILARIAERRPKIPRGLEKTWKWEGRMAGLATGSLAGAKLGAGFGIATAGWGMAATIPGAIIGGIVGVLVGDKVGGGVDKKSKGFLPDVAKIANEERVRMIPKPKRT